MAGAVSGSSDSMMTSILESFVKALLLAGGVHPSPFAAETAKAMKARNPIRSAGGENPAEGQGMSRPDQGLCHIGAQSAIGLYGDCLLHDVLMKNEKDEGDRGCSDSLALYRATAPTSALASLIMKSPVIAALVRPRLWLHMGILGLESARQTRRDRRATTAAGTFSRRYENQFSILDRWPIWLMIDPVGKAWDSRACHRQRRKNKDFLGRRPDECHVGG